MQKKQQQQQKTKQNKKQKNVACSAGVFWAGESLFMFWLFVSAIFDFMTEEDCMGRIEVVILLSSGVLTWRFREQKHSHARRRRLHCRLKKRNTFYLSIIVKTRSDMF